MTNDKMNSTEVWYGSCWSLKYTDNVMREKVEVLGQKHKFRCVKGEGKGRTGSTIVEA